MKVSNFYLFLVSLVIILIITIGTVTLEDRVNSLSNQIKAIKVPNSSSQISQLQSSISNIKPTVAPTSLTCTGTLSQTFQGDLYGDFATNNANDLNSTIKVTGVTPVILTCAN